MGLTRLHRQQAEADTRWGFDFKLLDELGEADAQQRRLEFVVLAMAGEVGELANIVKKTRRAMLLKQEPASDHTRAIRDECADVFAYLLKLCNLFGWDLDVLYQAKMAENERRFGAPGASNSSVD
jgi:NTP pyrophosphatase (non-canonical NTP hydrolase)